MGPATGEVAPSASPGGSDIVELLGPLDREPAQTNGVEQSEDGGVDADAERERENGDEREEGLETQAPGGVAEVRRARRAGRLSRAGGRRDWAADACRPARARAPDRRLVERGPEGRIGGGAERE